MFDPTLLRKLIYEHGTTVTLRKRANGTYNVTTGKLTQTPTDYQVKVYFFNNDPSVGEFAIVSKAERRAVVSDKLTDGTDTPEIDSTDEIIFGGKTTEVTRVTKISSYTATMCQLLYLKD